MTFHIWGNGTDTVGWQQSPQKRGTFDILTICILTLLLCVWNAIHPNIPPRGNPCWNLLKRCGIVAFALIMPEFIVYLAWCQRSIAHQLMADVNEAFGLPKWSFWSRFRQHKKEKQGNDVEQQRNPAKEAEGTSRFPWTPTHGFYVMMGGFGFDIPELLPKAQEFRSTPVAEHWTVSVEGFRLMLQEDDSRYQIPNLSDDDIRDKSKADGVLKLLICFQMTWFGGQVITRLVQGLAISLLELNTFGHCVCAVLIYILWWDKPQDVEQSHQVSSNRLLSCRALREMFKSTPNVSRTRDYMMQQLRQREDLPVLKEMLRKHPRRPNTNLPSILDDSFFKLKLEPGQHLAGTGVYLPDDIVLPGDDVDFSDYHFFLDGSLKETFLDKLGVTFRPAWLPTGEREGIPPATALDLYTKDIVRWRLAWDAIRANEFEDLHRPFDALEEYSTNMPNLDRSLLAGIMLLLSGALYGGLHAVAWNANFTTETEQLLWRISTCVIMCGGPAIMLTAFILGFIATLLGDGPHISRFSWLTLWSTILFLSLFYLAARLYLIVECFLNLANLPESAYDLPSWAPFLPHIT